MRIIGFPKFIKDEESEERVLKNCSLVIDAQHFFYEIYKESGLPYVFGSEANEYAKYIIRTKLTKFKKANVQCYFVFRGGNTDINRKKQKVNTVNVNLDSFADYVAPLFLKEVSLDAVEIKEFKYSTCVLESKNDIVALAHKLGCPILSYDIEFCFRGVPYVVGHQYVNPDNFITGRLFDFKKFLNKHSLTERKAMMFASLSDTDVFPVNYFNDLLKEWNVCDEILYEQNKKLLKWLSEHQEDEILNRVSEFLPNDIQRQIFLNNIDNLLNNMQVERIKPTVTTEYLLNDCKLTINRQDPMWFEKGVASQNIPIPYINLYKHRFVLGSCLIETKTSTDSVLLSIDIIKYAYSLLTNFKNAEITIYVNKDSNITLDTESHIKKPIYECKESVFENGWNDVKKLKLFEHFLTENGIDIDLTLKFPIEGRILLISLAYFTKKKLPKGIDVKKVGYSFIICFFILHQLRVNKFHQKNDYGYNTRKNRFITQDQNETAILLTQKYFKLEENEMEEIFDGDLLISLVEMQYCLLHMNYLNVLCGTTYVRTKYHKFFNGTFVYKLLHDMRDRDPEQFVNDLFRTVPSVRKCIKSLIVTYDAISSGM